MLPISNLSNTLVAIDNFCDYIPIVSTITNTLDIFAEIFQRCVLSSSWVSNETKQIFKDSYYFNYISHCKELPKCFIFLIPVIGNIAKLLCRIFQGLSSNTPYSKRNNKFYVYNAIKNNYYTNFSFASESLRNDQPFLLDMIAINNDVAENLDKSFKWNKEFMLKAVKRNATAVIHFNPPKIKDADKANFYLEAVKLNPDAINHITFRSCQAAHNSLVLYQAIKSNKEASLPKAAFNRRINHDYSLSSDEKLKENIFIIAKYFHDTNFINAFQPSDYPKLYDDKILFQIFPQNVLFENLPPDLKRQVYFDYTVLSVKEDINLLIDFTKQLSSELLMNSDELTKRLKSIDIPLIFKDNDVAVLEKNLWYVRNEILQLISDFKPLTLNETLNGFLEHFSGQWTDGSFKQKHSKSIDIVSKSLEFFQNLFNATPLCKQYL